MCKREGAGGKGDTPIASPRAKTQVGLAPVDLNILLRIVYLFNYIRVSVDSFQILVFIYERDGRTRLGASQ